LQKFLILGTIKISNIRVYAYHGCLVEEGKIGSDYRIDLSVKVNLKPSAKTDQLADTVDYVHLNRIVKEEMAVRTKLLEAVADLILDRILREIPLVNKVKIKVSKLNPPIGGNVEMVSIIMERER
jgi:dihydroneopterin aldolase